jgi:hypothetical protein
MKNLIAQGLDARTVADVDALEKSLERAFGGAKDRYLGDRATNWSALSSGVDPQSVVFERVTNMWDALLEAEAAKLVKQKRVWANPTEAAHALLGVPLNGPSAMPAGQRSPLAPRSLVQLLDSDESVRRPSIAFRDRGIGLTTAEMPKTILAIEGSNKLDKPYLHGVFGKGGSVLCMFCEATIIITRKQPGLLGEGEEDRVSMAVVRQGDAPDVRLPYFRYWVRPEDDLPFSMPASEVEFDPGTYVVHIGYQGDRLTQQTWEKEESIYAFAETVLFRPTLPYQLHDARSGEANTRPKERQKPSTLQGLGQRLDSATKEDGLLDASGMSRVPIPNVGEIGLRWWLFENTDRRRRRAAKGFVGLFVTGGQVHHAWSTSRFTQFVEARRRVAQRIIVEVDTEGLAQQDKVRIFSSFRDMLLKSPQATALERAVADWLARDADLDEAETQLTIKALGGGDGEVSAAFRDRLNRAVRAAVPGLAGAGAGVGSGATPKPPKPRPQEELYAEPTAFTGPESIELLPGQRKSFHMQCNAIDGFVPDRSRVNVIAGVGSPPVQFGRGDLRRGRVQVSLLVAAEAPLGSSELEIALVWNSDNGKRVELRWPLKVNVVAEPTLPKPPRQGNDRKQRRRGDVAFLWTDSEKKKEWDKSVVGELEKIKGSALAELQPNTYGHLKNVEDLIPTVVLNRSFRDLDAYLKGIAKRTGDQALEVRRDKYALALGVTITNMYTREQKLTEEHKRWEEAGAQGLEPNRPMTDAQKQRALVEDARGVLALLPDFDTLLGDLRQPDESANAEPEPAST